MGSSKETTTRTTTLPGIGNQEQQSRNILSQLGESGMGQLGDLSALASGQLQLEPSDIALLNQIQELTGQSARAEMGRNLDFASGDLEEQLLARGVEGSSIEGLEQGLLRTEALHGLNQSSIQGQIQMAQGSRQQMFDRAGLQLNANQLLLNQILGGSGNVAQMGLTERINQPTTTEVTEKPFDWAGAAMTLGEIGAGIATGGASTAVTGAARAAGRGASELQGPGQQGQPITNTGPVRY